GKRLMILAHHYQQDEVIQHADFIGGSLKARATCQTILNWVDQLPKALTPEKKAVVNFFV
ncbi:MAG: quinolinate synthase NadA, partial [Planctomycetota bacterium]